MIDVIRLLEGAHVGCKAKEADRLENAACLGIALNGETVLLEQIKLSGNIDGRFWKGFMRSRQA